MSHLSVLNGLLGPVPQKKKLHGNWLVASSDVRHITKRDSSQDGMDVKK